MKTNIQNGPKVDIQYIVNYCIATFGPPCTFMVIFRSIFLRIRNVSKKSCR